MVRCLMALLVTLVLSLLVAPLAAAPPQGALPRIGYLEEMPGPLMDTFRQGLARAATSAFPLFRRFVNGLREDYAAVKAGVTLPWSQGPIEGQINRLKMLKRQMFGRAQLDLLARRFLLAT